MLTKFSAAWLLALMLSPCTAPFRTCDAADFLSGGGDHTVALAVPTSMRAPLADDPDSLPPFDTKAKRLRLAQVSGFVIQNFVVPSPSAFVEFQAASTSCIRRNSALPTVLRL